MKTFFTVLFSVFLIFAPLEVQSDMEENEDILNRVSQIVEKSDLTISDIDEILNIQLASNYVPSFRGTEESSFIKEYEWINRSTGSGISRVTVRFISGLNPERGIISIDLFPDSLLSLEKPIRLPGWEKDAGIYHDAGGRIIVVRYRVKKCSVSIRRFRDKTAAHNIVIKIYN